MQGVRLVAGVRARVPALLRVSARMLAPSGMRAMSAAAAPGYSFDTLAVTVPREHVFMVKINRPDNLNVMNLALWREMREVFQRLAEDQGCRAVVLGAEGRLFTAGLDVAEVGALVAGDEDPARKSRRIRKTLDSFQESFTALEKCPKPVVAAVHGACVGSGVDLVCAADIRYCASNAWFQVKEVDLGLAADVGTLQRLPKILGSESLVRELAFSSRKMFSNEALQCGLINRLFPTKESLEEAAVEMAATIAGKSPVAVQTSKMVLLHARDHSVQEGLDYVGNLNMLMLQSEDVMISAMAAMSRNKDKPTFAKL